MSMRSQNPITTTVWFLSVVIITMFSSNPVLNSLSFLAASAYDLCQGGRKRLRTHIFFDGLILCMTILNPLFSRSGATVLFVINDKPVTWEALVYGFFAAVMLVGTLYWFWSFTQIMTSEKLLYLFGKLSPRLALLLSMSLRYVPLFCRQAKRIDAAQRAMGLYTDENIVQLFRSKCLVFSALFTWSLENGIWSADSMAARGYGVTRRSHFSIISFRRSDGFFIGLCILLFLAVLYGMPSFLYYPEIIVPTLTRKAFFCYGAFIILILLPFVSKCVQLLQSKRQCSHIDRRSYEELFIH